MPYSAKKPPKELTKKIKKKYPEASKSQIRKFIHIFNNSLDSGDSESIAFSKAWGVLKRDNKRKADTMSLRLVKLANILDGKNLIEEALLVDQLIITAQESDVKAAYQNFMQKINTFRGYLKQYLEMQSHTSKDRLRINHMIESVYPLLVPTLSIAERINLSEQKISDLKNLGPEGIKLADFVSKGILGINESQKRLEMAKSKG